MAGNIVAWSQSVDTSAALTEHSAVSDPIQPTSGNDVFITKEYPYLAGVYAIGASITLARFSAPSLRKPVIPDIEPIDRSATPSNPTYFHDWFAAPIKLDVGEGLRFLAAEDAAGAARQSGFAWLWDGAVSPIRANVRPFILTATTTLTTFSWTNAVMTLGQTLESGDYDIVGMRARSTGLIAARLVFPNSATRPGVLGTVLVGNNPYEPFFRYGSHGKMGSFNSRFPPSVDFFSSSADTSETVVLDIIKTG